MNGIKKAILKQGYNVGCVSDTTCLLKSQVKGIINTINKGGFPSVLEFNDYICIIDEPCTNNELDVIIKPKGYFN